MRLYHTAQTRSMRVLWLLEELGLDYELNRLPFDPDALSLADHLDVGRLGELPILLDGGVSMTESIEIIHYLIRRYGAGQLAPDQESDDYGPYLEWIDFGESKLMDPLSQWLQHSTLLPESERDADAASRSRAAFEHFASQVDAALARHDYLVGDTLTAADIVVGHALFLADRYSAFPQGCANLRHYFERLRARPSFAVAADS